MDFTTLPPQLIYKKRKSLEEFTNNNEINECLVDNMLDIEYLQSYNFKERVTTYLNAAYYICTLILIDKHPEWSLSKYYDIACCNQNNGVVSQAVTLSIVKIYLLHFDSDWQKKHKKLVEKLDIFLDDHWVHKNNPFFNDHSYMDTFNLLNSSSVVTSSISPSEFTLRPIDQSAIDEMRVAHFSWTTFTEYYNYDIMKDLVYNLGKEKEGMDILVKSLRHDAEEFYSKKSPVYESIYNKLQEIEHDIYLEYIYPINALRAADEMEEMRYLDDVRPLKARIAELEKHVELLNKQLSEKEEASNDDIDEIFDNNKKVQPQSKINSQANISDSSSVDLRHQLTEAKKTIEEQAQIINDLKESISEAQKRTLLMSKKKDKREGIQIGLTREQWVIFGKYLAEKLELKYTNKKQLAPILHALSGWGEKSLSNLMSAYMSEEDEKYVASIFGLYSSDVAKGIYKKWDETISPPWNIKKQQE